MDGQWRPVRQIGGHCHYQGRNLVKESPQGHRFIFGQNQQIAVEQGIYRQVAEQIDAICSSVRATTFSV